MGARIFDWNCVLCLILMEHHSTDPVEVTAHTCVCGILPHATHPQSLWTSECLTLLGCVLAMLSSITMVLHVLTLHKYHGGPLNCPVEYFQTLYFKLP